MQPEKPLETTTDDYLRSFELLNFELEDILEKGANGDALKLRLTAAKLREWRLKFNARLREFELAVGDFDALDVLLESLRKGEVSDQKGDAR